MDGMIDYLDFRLDGRIRSTTSREAKESGTFTDNNGMIQGRTKTFGVISMGNKYGEGPGIMLNNNSKQWRKKIDNLTESAEYDIRLIKRDIKLKL